MIRFGVPHFLTKPLLQTTNVFVLFARRGVLLIFILSIFDYTCQFLITSRNLLSQAILNIKDSLVNSLLTKFAID